MCLYLKNLDISLHDSLIDENPLFLRIKIVLNLNRQILLKLLFFLNHFAIKDKRSILFLILPLTISIALSPFII